MLNTKKNSKAKGTASKTADEYDLKVAAARKVIEQKKQEIKDLLAEKLNAMSGDFAIGSTIYYPAPPQKNIVPCRLEIEETRDGDIQYFARPICVDKKTGDEYLSKRHYSLGTDLSKCEDIYSEPPKTSKKKDDDDEVTITPPKKKAKKLGKKK